MSSFYAELEVGGHTYPVRSCHFAFTQATNERGRVAAKVRHGLLHLTLDVPDDEALVAWGAAPFKPLAGHVTFFASDERTARETVGFVAGQCVGYHETFAAGDNTAGAYVCQLTIAAERLELLPGGPAWALVAAATRDYVTVAAAEDAALPPVAPPEYTAEEFKATIWGADQVAPDIIDQLYAHFLAAKASTSPTPRWFAMDVPSGNRLTLFESCHAK